MKYCDAILHGVGPLNITRKMGEENVHIDCPFSTTNAPFWRINNSQYGPSSLPSLVNPTVFGITITTVNDALNQTTFQCLTPSGTGSDVLVSEVGMLTVTESGKTPGSVPYLDLVSHTSPSYKLKSRREGIEKNCWRDWLVRLDLTTAIYHHLFMIHGA